MHRPSKLALMALGLAIAFATGLRATPAVAAPLQQIFDLSITKTGPLDIDAGEEAFFEVTVCNQGPSTFSGPLAFRDDLPTGFAFLGDSMDVCTINGPDTLRCVLGGNVVIQPGQCTEPLVIKTRAPADYVVDFAPDDGVVEAANTATITQPAVDVNTANNSDTHGFFVQDSADLKITKLVEPFTGVRAGDTFTYTIFVDNLGPSAARNVTITDTLLSSGRVSIQSCAFSVSQGGGAITQFTCTTGNLVSTQFGTDIGTMRTSFMDPRSTTSQGRLRASFRLVARQDIDVTNLATVVADTPDPDTSNNMAMSSLSVSAVADLRVTHNGAVGSTVSAPSCNVNVNTSNRVTAGLDIRYSASVANLGPSTAHSVVLENPVPAGTVAADVTCLYQNPGQPIQIFDGKPGAPGDPNDPSVCVFPELGANRQGTMDVKLQVDPDYVARFGDPQLFGPQSAQLPLYSRGYSDELDPNLSNNIGVYAPTIGVLGLEVDAFADLQVFVNDAPDPVRAGEGLTYEVIVNNAGPSLAEEVALSFALPNGVTFLDAQVIDGGSGLACTLANVPNIVICELGDIEPGDQPLGQRSVIVNTRVDSDVPPGALVASATANTFQTPDCNTTNNVDVEESTQVQTRTQIEVRKSSSPLNPVAGRTFLWTYEITNNGPSDAFNVEFTDTLPQGTTSYGETVYFEYVDDQANGFCDLTSTGPDTIRCRPAGNAFTNPPYVLPAGESVTFSILVRIDERMPPGRYTNLASVSVGNPNFSVTSFGDDVEVRSVADLKISKFVSPHNPVRAGEQFTYTMLIDNLGPSTAYNVVITDTLISSGFVRANGCSLSVRTEGGLIDEFDCNFALSTGVFDLATMGSNHLNPRSPTDKGRIIITVNLTADEAIDLTNVSTVTSESFDPNTDNNMAMVAHSVSAVADLSVTKVAAAEVQVDGQPGTIPVSPFPFPEAPSYALNPDRVTAGRLIQYTIEVANAGPSTAENVYISDRLPQGVTVLDYAVTGGSGGDCTTGTPGEAFDQLVCGLGLMGVEGGTERRTITVLARVDASLPPGSVLENDVYVDSDTYEPRNGNNRTSTLTTVDTWADMEITKLSVGQVKTGYDSGLRREILEDLPGQVTAGHELRYEITVQNNGPSDAQNVQVLDLLPGQTDTGLDHDPVTFLRADGAYCRPADELQEIGVFGPGGGKFGQVLWCSLGTVAPGERVTFDVYVQVDNAVPDGFTLTNGAFVWWGDGSGSPQPDAFLPFPFPQLPPALPTTPDPFLDDNFSSTDTLVTAVADVYIDKVDVPASPALDQPFEPDHAIAGSEHRYLITFGNLGWSVARDIAIRDFLDFKQFGILGERFLRCEPFDDDDIVDCSEAGGIVDVDLLLEDGEQILPGDLNPGDEYHFYLVTEVDAGYVLDGDDFIATNDTVITTTTTDFHGANNIASHDTLIVAEADLAIEKTDIFGSPLTDPDNYFLMCDPVEPGGMITYDLTVTNNGPSDAADVYVVDQLPADYVAVDPAQVVVTVSAGEVVEVRDDGQITVRLGNDVNNAGANELGRLNAGSTETIRIEVMVRQDAECGGLAENHAYVETRANPVDWPPAPDYVPGVGGGPRTPTADPDPTNNRALESTKIECPKITVNKTVSFNGQCPGSDVTRIYEPGQPVTFCYEITNTGTTYLDTILVTDTLKTRTTMPTVVFTDTITFGVDPKLPVAPGETVLRQVTVPHFTKECGIATDTVVVSATPVNSGRTILPCLAPVTAQDTAVVEVPCAGVDWRIALPVLEANEGAECAAWLQVQNVGDVDTKAVLVVWGDPGFCPPQSAGPLKVECTGLLRPGSAWSFAAGQMPAGARSAIAYSVNAKDVVKDFDGNDRLFADVICGALFDYAVGDHDRWATFDRAYRLGTEWRGPRDNSGFQLIVDFGAHQGEPLTVSVNRSCPDAADPNAMSNAAYTGLSRDQLGVRDPVSGAYMYYSPLLFANNAGLNSLAYLQNLGDECTSLEIWLKGQDNCLRPIIGDILTLAPGESVAFDPNTVVGPDWLGSAWIRATQPLAIVVDTKGANHFTAYTGVAANVDELGYTYGNQVNFAPLVYSEYQGWDTAIQVQNLSPVVNAKVKVYFLDRSGDVITTLVDWICPRGSQTFFLPTIAALGGNWVGSARVESQDWWAPGTNPIDHPKIASVVLLEKWSDPARTTRREAVAYNAQTECLLYDWQVGSGKGGTQSGSAVFAVPLLSKGNRGVNSELAITNLVAKPGFTDFAIYIYDQNGLLDFVCQKLHDRQVEYIDLATWGYVPPNFLGSAVVSATFWEHDVFDPEGGFVRNLVGLGGVVVERIGATLGQPDVPGDESKAFEAAPVFDHFGPDSWGGAPPVCPGQPGWSP